MKREEEDVYDARCSWLFSFILGGLVGAGIALLMAPKAGKETREQIKGMAADAKEKAGEYYDEVKGKAAGYYDEVKGKAAGYYDEARGKAAGYYDEAKEKVQTAVEKGKEVVQTKKAEVEAAVEKGVEKARETFRHVKGETTE